jgi:hypothetical protein
MPRLIQLTFSDEEGNTLTRGPFQGFLLQGETLRQERDGPVVAVHREHFWELEGRRFGRFDCDCRICIRVTRVDGMRSQDYGPFESFSARDGITFTDHQVFAFADRSIGDWYCHADGLHWAMLLVRAVD